MNSHITTKRCFVAFGVAIFIFMAYGGVIFIVNARIQLKLAAADSDLADIKEAFILFHEKNDRWPHTIADIYGINTSEGIVTEDWNRDPFSGLPYCCVTDKNMYYRLDDGKPQKILVMLPMPFRTKAWPFGETRTSVATASDIYIISDDKIIEMNQK
jgi:hypothetical protein